MIWTLLAIASGFFDAVALAFLKKLSSMDKMMLLIFRHLISLPFIAATLLYFGIPQVSGKFYIVLLLNVITMLFGMYYSIKSLEIANLSTAVPMISFTPVFLIFVSFITLGEVPTWMGVAGILLVVAGSYALNLKSIKFGILQPILSIFRDKGNLYMLIAAFIFSFNAVLTKMGIELSNSAYFIFANYVVASAAMLILLSTKLRTLVDEAKANLKNLLYLGISTTVMEITYAVAVIYLIVPYAISFKRTGIFFSALIGLAVFREKNYAQVISGSILVFAGVVLIAFS